MSTAPAPASVQAESPPADSITGSCRDGTATFARLPMTGIAEEVRQEVEAMDYPAVLPTVIAAQMERARLQITTAAPCAIDKEKSTSDALLLQDIGAARELHTEEQVTPNRDLYEARKKAAATEPPLTRHQRRLVVILALIAAAVAVLGLRELMAPSVSEFLLAPYSRAMLGKVGLTVSDERARDLMLYLGATLFFSEVGIVLATWGNLAGWIKAGFFVVACLVSIAFGSLRMTAGFSWPAISFSIFEGALLVAFSLFAVGLSAYLARDRKQATEYRTAHELVAIEEHEETKRAKRSEKRETDYRQLHRQIAEREAAVRRLDQATELAEQTAQTAALIATAKVISCYAKKAQAGDTKADHEDPQIAEPTAPPVPPSVEPPKKAGGAA